MKDKKSMRYGLVTLTLLLAVLMFAAACSEQSTIGTDKKGDKENQHEEPNTDSAVPDPQEAVHKLLESMTLEEKIGQMFMSQLAVWEGEETKEMNPEVKEMITSFHLGGVILFEKNMSDVEQLITFIHDMQEASSIPMFVGLDHEGGRVKRLPEGTHFPGNMAMGAAQSPSYVYQAGLITGKELQALGFNVNFAPVLDVNNNLLNPVIGVRSYGEDPYQVAVLGNRFVEGLKESGVIATAKHFPGHGDTDVDSHVGLPLVDKSEQEMSELEWLPFRHVIQAGVGMVMTAHIMYPQLDSSKVTSLKDGSEIYLPATFSEKILTDILRERLEFDGVIVTDAFKMKAIADHFGESEAVLRSVMAGADILLMPRNLEEAYDSLLHAVQRGQISEERVDQSVLRILNLKQQYNLLNDSAGNHRLEDKRVYANEIVGHQEHKELEREITKAAATWLRHDDKIEKWALGKVPDKGGRILVITPGGLQSERIQVVWTERMRQANDSFDFTWETVEQVIESGAGTSPFYSYNGYDLIILMTQNLSLQKDTGNLDEQLNAIVEQWEEEELDYIHVALELPYDVLYLPAVLRSLTLYGSEELHYDVMYDVIFHGEEAKGVPPVRLPKSVENSE